MKEEFLSIQSAAEFLGVSPTTLRRWEEKGVLIPERTFGNQRRYALSVLKVFNKKNISLIETHAQAESDDQKNQESDTTPLSHSSEKPILQEYLFTSPINAPIEPFFTHEQNEAMISGNSSETLNANDLQTAILINKARRKGNFFNNNPKTVNGLFIITCIVLILTAFSFRPYENNTTNAQAQTGKSVLGIESKGRPLIGDVLFSIPALFNEKVTISNEFEVNGQSLFTEDIKVANKNIDLGSGELTASNVIYTITAGANVSISGDPQNPTISANLDIPNAVVSFQGQSGNVTLAEGDGIGLDGLTISNTGVLSIGGETGDVELTAGDGIEVDGTTITNTDTGSAQNIFKEFIIDGSSILAGSNSDVFTFEAGSGIVLTPDTTTKKLTITSNASGTLSGLSTNGVLYATDSTNATSTSPGTTGTVLKGVTAGAPIFGAVSLSADITGTLPIGNGGTGVTGTPSNGQLLIGNGSGYTIGTISSGSGINVSNGAGTISITNNGVLSLAGTANQVSVSGATGSITLSLPQNIHTGATPTFASMTLSSNTNQLTLGTGNTGTFTLASLTSGQTYTLPDQSGEVCLSTGNCPGGGSGTIDGSGTTNYLAKFTGGTNIGNSLLYDTGQRIGIGTVSPQGLFSVSGASTGSALFSLNETGDQAIFTASSSGTTRFTIGNNGNLSATGTITGLTGLTSSGTITFSGLTTNNGLLYTNGSGTLSQAAAGTSGQLLVANGSGIPVFVSLSSDATLASNGTLTIAGDAVALGTDTTGNYVQTVSGGSGVSVSGSAGEGWTPTFALGPLTSNWDQTGAFDIILNNSSSEFRILESSGAFYATIDAGDLDADKTYVLPTFTGSSADFCLSTGNCAGGAGGSKWQLASNVIAPLTATDRLVLGGNISTGHQFEVNGKQTGKALVSLNETGNQNIFSASASGTTVMNITRNGNLQLLESAGNTYFGTIAVGDLDENETYTLPPINGASSADICLSTGNCAGGLGGTKWILNSNTLSPLTATDKVVLGGNTTSPFQFEVNGKQSGKALVSLNETGNQDILTASASGVTRLTLSSTGNLNLIGGVYQSGGTSGITQGSASCVTTTGGIVTGFGTCQLGSEQWLVSSGSISTGNPSLDLLLGGNATASSKFAFIGVSGGTPTASISAGTGNNATFLTGAGNLGTTNAQTLTVGGSSTGNIVLDSGSGAISILDGLTIAGNTDATNGLDVTGAALTVGGTNATISIAGIISGTQLDVDGTLRLNGQTLSAESGDLLLTAADGDIASANRLTVGTQTPGIGQFNVIGRQTGKALSILNETGDQALFTASSSGTTRFTIANNGTVTASAYGIGVAKFDLNGTISSGTLDLSNASYVTNALDASNGGTGFTSYVTGDLLVGNGSNTLSKLGIGGEGSILTVQSGTPTWISTSSINFWQRALGAVSPLNSTDDLLLGGSATSSAKFAFINNIGSGTPTASISAGSNNATYIAGNGVLGTTNAQSFTLGSSSTGNISIAPKGVNLLNLSTEQASGNVAIGTMPLQDWAELSIGAAAGQNSDILLRDGDGNNTWDLFADIDGTFGIYDVTNGKTPFFVDPNTPSDTLHLTSAGGVSIGNSNAIGIFDVRGTTAGKALAVINEIGGNDIFTASTAGTTRFTIANNGSINSVGNYMRLGPVDYAVPYTLANNSYLILDKGNTASDASLVLRDQGAARAEIGLITDNSIHFKTATGTNGSETFTDRLIIDTTGNVYTANAGKLGVGTIPTEQLHVAGDYAAARLMAKIENTTAGAGHSSALWLRGGSTVDWLLGTDFGINGNNNFFLQDSTGGLRMFVDGGGKFALGGTNANPLATLDLRTQSATLPVASISGQTTNAGIIVDNTGTGDLFTASKSGAVKFVIKNNGDLRATNYNTAGGVFYGSTDGTLRITAQGTSGECLQSTGVGGAPTWGSCGGAGSTTNYWNLANGLLYNGNTTTDFAVGGISTTSAKFLVSMSGTRPTASVSANTSYAGLVVDNRGVGDLFTASKSGATKFVINNNGNVGINTNTATSLVDLTSTYANKGLRIYDNTRTKYISISDDTANVTMSATGQNFIFDSDIYINASDLFLGGNTLYGDQSIANADLILDSTSSTTKGNVLINPSGGRVGIGLSSNLLATLDVRGTSATSPVASFAGQTSFAALALDNSSSGDLFTASKSGATKFVIKNNGDLRATNYNTAGGVFYGSSDGTLRITAQGTSGECLQSTGVGGAPTWGSCGGGSTTNYWNLANGLLYNGNLTTDFAIGGNASTSAKFLVSVSGTRPTASVSANTSNAGLVVDNRGVGDLFTASKSGATKFVIKNNGYIGIGESAPWAPVTVSSDAPELVNGRIVDIEGNLRSTSNDQFGIYVDPAVIVGSASTRTYSGGIFMPTTLSSNLGGATLQGVVGSTYVEGAVAVGDLKAGYFQNQLIVSGASTTNSYGVYIDNPSKHAGAAITTNYGLYVNAQTAGSTNYSAYFDGTRPISIDSGTGSIYFKGDAGGWSTGFNAYGSSGTDRGGFNFYGTADTLQYYYLGTGGEFNNPLLNVLPNGSVGIGIPSANLNSPLATFDVRGKLGTSPVASLSGQTSRAALVVDNIGVGDLFTASKSGAVKFVIKNNGDLRATNYNTAGGIFYGSSDGTLRITAQGTSGECLQSTGVGGAPTWGTCGGAGSTTNYWNLANGLLYNGNTTTDFAVGGISTTSAKFLVSMSGTRPTASVSANTSYAGLVVNNNGVGDLFTASKSGKTHFTIRNSGTVVIGNSTDGITLDPQNGGPSYAGNARPTKTISLQPEYSGAVLTAFYGAGTDTNITGNLTSDVETSGTNNLRSYYQWERTTDATQHFYTVAVRVRLPKDFSAWTSSNAIQVDYITESATSTNSDLDVRVYIDNDASMASTDAESLNNTSTSWSTVSIAGSSLTEVDAADETAVIYLRMGSASSFFVKIGEIKLNYLSRF